MPLRQIPQLSDDSMTLDFLSQLRSLALSKHCGFSLWTSPRLLLYFDISNFILSVLDRKKNRKKKWLEQEHADRKQKLMPSINLSPVSKLQALCFHFPLPVHTACDNRRTRKFRSIQIPHLWVPVSDWPTGWYSDFDHPETRFCTYWTCWKIWKICDPKINSWDTTWWKHNC